MFSDIEANEYMRLITVASMLQLKSKMVVLDTQYIDKDAFIEWVNTINGIATAELILQHLLTKSLIKIDSNDHIQLTDDGDSYINYLTD